MFNSTITNTGSIIVEATNGHASNWDVGGRITLTGGGSITLSQSSISGSGNPPSFVNADNFVSGDGSINSLLLINQAAGTIDADTRNTLTIATGQTINNAGTLEATNAGDQAGGTLTITDDVSNSGTIGAYDDGLVNVNGAVTGGTVTAQRDGSLSVKGMVANATLDAADNGSIEFAGSAAGSTFVTGDEGRIYIEGSVSGSSITATGNAGKIYLSGLASDDSLLVDAANNVLQISGTIVRGAVVASNGAAVTIANGTLDSVVTAGAIVVDDLASVTNGQNSYSSNTLTLRGSLDDLGSITLDGVNAAAMILAGSPTTTLVGGQVILTDGGDNVIGATQRGNVLDNQGSIVGNGSLGDGLLAFTNEGVIDATGGSELFVETTTSKASVNTGTIQATAGGTLEFVRGTFTNNGVLDAGADSSIYFDRATVPSNLTGSTLTGGTWTVEGNAILSLSGSAITTDAASINLSGAGAIFSSGGSASRALEQSLMTIATTGSLVVTNHDDSFANTLNVQGTLSAGGGTVSLTASNLASGTLTGGTWGATNGGVLLLSGGPVVTDAAAISLVSAASASETVSGGVTTTIEQSLTTIAAAGSLNTAFQSDTFANAIELDGVLSVFSGTFTSGLITATAGSTIEGQATIASSVQDAGTILANGFGMSFSGAANSFTGLVTGTGGFSITGGASTIGAGANIQSARWGIYVAGTTVAITTNLTYAGALTIDAGATLSVAAARTLTLSAATALSGTLQLADGNASGQTTLALTGDLTGSGGIIQIGAHDKATLTGAVGAGETIGFGGAGSTIVLGQPDNFAGTVTGFSTGDAIDLSSETATAVSHTTSSVTVTLSGGATQTFALSGSYADLALESDDAGGTELVAISNSPVTLQAGSDVVAFAAGSTGNVVSASAATLNASDRIWGNGTDTFALAGGGSLDLAAMSHFSGFSTLTLDDQSYSIVLGDSDLAAGKTLAVNGSALDASASVIVNGAAERDGLLNLVGGAGADQLTGGHLGDNLTGGAGNDLLDGGGGFDRAIYSDATAGVTVDLSRSGPQATGWGMDQLTNIEAVLGSNFDDVLMGNSVSNELKGGAGNDRLVGGAGNDTLNGGSGVDTADYSGAALGVHVDLSNAAAQNTQVGSDTLISIENLLGGAYNDVLTGSTAANVLSGGAGIDKLDGGLGKDTLTGGAGNDKFYFTTTLGSANIDTITDFTAGQDKMYLDHNVFAGLIAGGLPSGAFYAGTGAHDPDDRVIYNSATGALLFDSDGTGSAAAVQFATLSTGLNLSAASFTVV